MKNKIKYTWEWVHEMVENIATQVDQTQQLEAITGVSRGGLIPAILLSYRLDTPYIPLEQAQDLIPGRRKRIMLVDDIADSGYTMRGLEHFNFITATLTKRYTSAFTPNIAGSIITDDHWLVFPWEATDSQPIQDYLTNK